MGIHVSRETQRPDVSLSASGIAESTMRAQVASAILVAEGFSRGPGGADLAVVNNDARLPRANPAVINEAGLGERRMRTASHRSRNRCRDHYAGHDRSSGVAVTLRFMETP